jgi:filamentous hemagglutinin family protein
MYKTELKLNRRLCRLAVSLLVGLWAVTPGWVNALPSGDNIVSGDGKISSAGPDMTIYQESSKLAIDWQSFNIGATESVIFKQPDVNSVAFNRVIGVDPSKIYGNLSANGQVFLSNPSGVVFGRGAVVDVHGLLATTFSISPEDFMAGNYKFSQDVTRPLAAIINNGAINAERYVGLAAPAMENTGSIIVADLGTMTEGYEAAPTLDFNGDGLISFAVTREVSKLVTDQKGNLVSDQINNSGTIRANSGKVLLTTRLARNVISNVVNHSGVTEAQTVLQKNGKIVLSSGANGSIQLSGTLDASNVLVKADAVTVGARKFLLAYGYDEVSEIRAASDGLTTNNGNIRIVANDLDLKDDLNSGTGNVVFVQANGDDLDLTPGNAKGSLGGNDIGHIIAKNLILRTRGDINVKGITKGDTAGIKNSVVMKSGGDINFDKVASAFPALKLRAINDVNVNTDVTTTRGNVRIAANDLNLNADLTSGGNKVVFTRRKGQDLRLAQDDAVGTLSSDDLRHINAKKLVLRTRGDINVNGITEKDTAGITDSVILKSRKDINFEDTASLFPALNLRAFNDINVNVDVTTTKGDFIAKADVEKNDIGEFNVAPGVVITSARDIDVSAPTINADNDEAFNEARDLILNGDVTDGGPPVIDPIVAESITQGSLGTFLTEFLENGGPGGC